MVAAMVFSIFFLLGVLGLGFMASWKRIDPNLHAMAAFLAGVLAVGLHIHGGSGPDFLAVVLLLAALGLGLMVAGGGVSSQLHLWAAIPAVAASAYAHAHRLLNQD